MASHVLAAYRAGPAGRPDRAIALQAVVALRAAADRAMSLHSPEQAFEFLEGALSVTADDTERAQLWEQAALSAQASARLSEAASYARLAIDWHEAHGDRSACGPDDRSAGRDPGHRLRGRGVDRGRPHGGRGARRRCRPA